MAQAKQGDGDAFGRLVEPYQRELHVHCYRILGSVQEAEDALQESLLSAWQGLQSFEERSSFRTWLYKIATNRCLNALRTARRRPRVELRLPAIEFPEPNRRGEIPWLEPYSDTLLEGMLVTPPGPEARYEMTEAISLAFIVTLQLLPPRQRAVLILRDVLGYHASEVAGILDTTVAAVTSALKRARASLQHRQANQQPPPEAGSPVEQHLVEQLVRAYQTGDIKALTDLLADDVIVSMPPLPLEYHGRELAARFMASVTFRHGRTYDLIPVRSNGQPAFGAYLRDPAGGARQAAGLRVLTLSGAHITRLTRFDNGLLPRFGLPPSLPGVGPLPGGRSISSNDQAVSESP